MISRAINGARGGITGNSLSILQSLKGSVDTVPRRKSYSFGGGIGSEFAKKPNLPVVCLPVLLEKGGSVQDAVRTLYNLQQLTSSFRVVALTDFDSFKSLRPYGWAISHIISEINWRNRTGSWSRYVEQEVSNLSRDYSCKFVLDYSSNGFDLESIQFLNSVTGLELEHSYFEFATDGIQDLKYSWRGWLEDLENGMSRKQVVDGKNVANLRIAVDDRGSLLLIVVNASLTDDQRLILRRRFWNLVEFSVTDTFDNSFVEAGLRSLADALSFEDRALVVGNIDFPNLALETITLPNFVENTIELLEDFEVRSLSIWAR